MANTRFGLPTNNFVPSATLINGDVGYTNPPPVSEAAQYPMSNLLVGDRYKVWRAGTSAPSPLYVDFDLGSAVNVQTLALHGFRRAAGASGPTQVRFGYFVGPYDGTGGIVSIESTISLAGAPRDVGVILIAPIAAQHWRVQFDSVSDGFSVGTIYIGGAPTDMGIIYSPGASSSVVLHRFRYQTIMGAPVINTIGDDGALYTLPFQSISTSTKDALISVARAGDPVTYIDSFNAVSQVTIANEVHESVHSWSPGDLWNVTLQLSKLP